MARKAAEIRRDLDEAMSRRSELNNRAAQLLARMRSSLGAYEERAIATLNADADEFDEAMRNEDPIEAADWSGDRWRDFAGAPAGAFLGQVRVGRGREQKLLPNERGVAESPFTIPLLDANGPLIFVCDDNHSRAVARATIQSIILRCAAAMPSDIKFRLIDPRLSGAFPMKALVERREPSRSISDDLAGSLQEIALILDNVVGYSPRFSALTPQQRGGEKFEVIALVDFPQAFTKDPRVIDQLVTIANSGPRAGRHVLLELDASQQLPRDFSLDRFEHPNYIDCRNLPFDQDQPPVGADQQRIIETARTAGATITSGDWDSLIRPKELFALKSTHRIETPLGERPKIWFGKSDDGREIGHALVAGQPGSGKSFLLHTMITGLAARYGPDELRLSLVDLKQGVEFRAYERLQHTDVVSLNTSPAMARSVLEDFAQEMAERFTLFGQSNAQNLEQYRERNPDVVMPRKLMIVDEYQHLLDSDMERVGAVLENVIQQGRAAGTHLVLAPQTFAVRGLSERARANIQVMMSLSLNHDYLQSLTIFGAEGKRLIRALDKHQVVVNLNGGTDGANTWGSVARLERNGKIALDPLVDELVASGPRDSRAVILDGREAVTLAENPFVMQWRSAPPTEQELNERARSSARAKGFGAERWTPADRPLPLWLGRKFDVHGHALAALRRAPSEHLLAVGTQAEKRLAMLANAVAGLLAMRPAQDYDVLLIDGLQAGYPGAGILRVAIDLLQRRGANAQVVDGPNAGAAIARFIADAETDNSRHRLLIVSEPEHIQEFAVSPQNFGPPPEGAAKELRRALQVGSQRGLHVILTTSSLNTLRAALRPNTELNFFNHRVVQQLSPDDSMTLFSGQEASRIEQQSDRHPMGALLVDMMVGVRSGTLFHSYGATNAGTSSHDAQTLSTTLSQIFG